jgi:hypothetical protein
VPLQDGDLLPDLALQADGHLLEVGDRLERLVVLEALAVERGDLADEAEHLGAVVEVAAHLEGRQAPHRRALGGLVGGLERVGVLGQLVHVHQVPERAQLLHGGEDLGALGAALHREQEEDGGAQQHHVVHGGLAHLDELGQPEARVGVAVLQSGHHREQAAAQDERHHGHAQRAQLVVGAGDPLAALLGVRGQLHQLFAQAREAAVREALVHAAGEQLRGAHELERVEAGQFGHGSRRVALSARSGGRHPCAGGGGCCPRGAGALHA